MRRGRTLGGSSSINGMVHVRGHPLDFNRWREQGLAGWGYEDILPYFLRMERDTGAMESARSKGGPLETSTINYPGLIYEQIEAAAAAVGLPANGSEGGFAQEGIAHFRLNIIQRVAHTENVVSHGNSP